MITIKGIYGREMFETWYAMSVLLEGGLDLAPVITGRYGYRDFERGVRRRGERARRQGHPRLDRRESLEETALMFDSVRDDLRATLDEIRAAGLHKPERVIGTPQPRP